MKDVAAGEDAGGTRAGNPDHFAGALAAAHGQDDGVGLKERVAGARIDAEGPVGGEVEDHGPGLEPDAGAVGVLGETLGVLRAGYRIVV